MTKRIKFLCLILTLILVLVSVPTSVVSEEMTEEQGDLSITETSNEAVEQQTTEFVTDVQDDLVTEQITLQEQINDIEATATSTQYQLVTDIPDGIYAIQISSLSSYFIQFPSTSSYVSCYSLPTITPTVTGMISYLFRITPCSGYRQIYN